MGAAVAGYSGMWSSYFPSHLSHYHPDLHCTVLPVMQYMYIQCCRKYVGLGDSETTITCAVSLANHEDPAEVKLNLHNRV